MLMIWNVWPTMILRTLLHAEQMLVLCQSLKCWPLHTKNWLISHVSVKIDLYMYHHCLCQTQRKVKHTKIICVCLTEQTLQCCELEFDNQKEVCCACSGNLFDRPCAARVQYQGSTTACDDCCQHYAAEETFRYVHPPLSKY